jgi:hypothetical protein
MMAAFQTTGAKYGTKNFRWLLSTPSAHTASTRKPVMGKTMRAAVTASSKRSTGPVSRRKPALRTATMGRARSMPSRDRPAAVARRMPKIAPANRPASSRRPSSTMRA